MNEFAKSECETIKNTLTCCKQHVLASFDEKTKTYDVRCQCCNKEMKSKFLSTLIFDWIRNSETSQIRSAVRTVDSKSINTGSIPVSGAKNAISKNG